MRRSLQIHRGTPKNHSQHRQPNDTTKDEAFPIDHSQHNTLLKRSRRHSNTTKGRSRHITMSTTTQNWKSNSAGSQATRVHPAMKQTTCWQGKQRNLAQATDTPHTVRNALPISLSATKQLINKLSTVDTMGWWKNSKRYKCINEIGSSLPSMKFIKC